jgi:hypothetical protein
MSYVPPGHVAVLNKSTIATDAEVAFWIEAYRLEVRRVADAWGLPPPGMALYPAGHTEEPDPAVAAIYIVDTANEPNALGYHTAMGRNRFGYVDMSMSARWDIPSVVFGHELYELFVDADVNRWAGPFDEGLHYAVEVCDPVQRDSYEVHVEEPVLGAAKVQCADFVFPSWFSPGSAGPYSYLGRAPAPLQDNAGGYHVTEQNGVVATGAARSYGRTFRRLVAGRR